VLFNTGGAESMLAAMEDGFRRLFEGKLPLTIQRLGVVDSLAQAYHRAIMSVEEADTLIVFAHQDAVPFIPRESPGLKDNLAAADWFAEAANNADAWFYAVMRRLSDASTGILGAVGCKGFLAETAWWQYPDLSGVVIATSADGSPQVNLYGEYGRVAALDGFLLMLKRETYGRMGVPPLELKGFHFYDMDLCMRAHIAGLKNYTIPLLLRHHSRGAKSSDPQWRCDQGIFNRIYAKYLPMKI